MLFDTTTAGCKHLATSRLFHTFCIKPPSLCIKPRVVILRQVDTNENRNGVVRKILPKGSPFDAILDEEMRRIDRMLNDRPLKCLNWRTPREAFTALLHRHLLAAA